MQTVSRQLSHKRKTMLMYEGKFYLRPVLKAELVSMIEAGIIVNDRAAIDFIDENGEWMSETLVNEAP